VTLFLALDTATELGSVAVGEPGAPLAELYIPPRRHASAVMPAVREVLRLIGAGIDDLQGIVVADGPGSFTGLRVSFATAKGIMMTQDALELTTIPSLMGAAWVGSSATAGPVAAMYDALRGEVFAAVYDFRGRRLAAVVPPQLTTVTQLAERSPQVPTLAVGDGAVVHREAVEAWTGRGPLGPPAGAPRAAALVELLVVDGAARRVPDPDRLEPEYGRMAEAQVRWEEKHGRSLTDGSADRNPGS